MQNAFVSKIKFAFVILTVTFNIITSDYKRTYSIDSACGQQEYKYTIKLIKGDILTLATKDKLLPHYTVVNPANTYLQMGGGVAGAIRNADTTNKIQEECYRILKGHPQNLIPTGNAILTSGGSLDKSHSIQYIIHAVGPDNRKKSENRLYSALLQQTYQSIFKTVMTHNTHQKENKINIIACPSISTGIFNGPLEPSATIAADVIFNTFQNYAQTNNQEAPIMFCMVVYDDYHFNMYEKAFDKAMQKLPGFIKAKH